MKSSHTKYGIGVLINRLGRSGSSLLTIAIVCMVVLGTVSIPVASGQTGTVDESRMAYVDGTSTVPSPSMSAGGPIISAETPVFVVSPFASTI